MDDVFAGRTSPFPPFRLLPIWFELFVWQWLSLGSGWRDLLVSGWRELDGRTRRPLLLSLVESPAENFVLAPSSLFSGAGWTSSLALLLGLGGLLLRLGGGSGESFGSGGLLFGLGGGSG